MKKTKRIVVGLMLGIMVLGSTLNAQAACGHSNGGHPVWSETRKTSAGSHIYGTGNVCALTKVTDYYKVICNDCASTIGGYSTSYTAHEVHH